MASLASKLNKVLHPHSANSDTAQPAALATASGTSTPKGRKRKDTAFSDFFGEVQGGTPCSSELFNVFKMMAAGRGSRRQTVSDEVDSEEDEDSASVLRPEDREAQELAAQKCAEVYGQPEEQPDEPRRSLSEASTLTHVESPATAHAKFEQTPTADGVPLSEEQKKAKVQEWMEASVSGAMMNQDTVSSRLTGDSRSK